MAVSLETSFLSGNGYVLKVVPKPLPQAFQGHLQPLDTYSKQYIPHVPRDFSGGLRVLDSSEPKNNSSMSGSQKRTAKFLRKWISYYTYFHFENF